MICINFHLHNLHVALRKIGFFYALVIRKRKLMVLTLAMYNAKQNTLGVKKCGANKKQPYLCAAKRFDIS